MKAAATAPETEGPPIEPVETAAAAARPTPPRPARTRAGQQQDNAAQLWQRLCNMAFSTPLYRPFLSGPPPRALLCIPPDPWPGNAERGTAIVQGRFQLNGEVVPYDPSAPIMLWQIAPVRAAPGLHGFSWLANLRAAGGDPARRRARELVESWIKEHPHWKALAWRPDILAQRITSWISHYEFFCASASEAFRNAVFDSLGRQARHLHRVAASPAHGLAALHCAKGLLYVGLCLEPGRGGGLDRLDAALKLLERQLAELLRLDGCYISRNPSQQLAAIRLLIDMRGALAAAGREIPVTLANAIDAMARGLRQLRHGDGGLGLFNGGHEEQGWIVDMVLAQAGGRGRGQLPNPEDLAGGGYVRLSAGRLLALMDAGLPPPDPYDEVAHCGLLSMEVSIGKERLIVNCGSSDAPSWRNALRATAAHSTLTVEDTNSSQLLETGGFGRRARHIKLRRAEADGNVWVDASHDGYKPRFKLIHRRRVYVHSSGGDLRGEDTLFGPSGHAFAIRFHLHPDVEVQLAQDGASALLRLPSGSGWWLRVGAGGLMALEESIYLGVPDTVRRSQQVVVRGTTQGSKSVLKWGLRRETAR